MGTNPWHRDEEPHNNYQTPGKQTKQNNHLDDCKVSKGAKIRNRYKEDIYFFEVNTKYISSRAVKKICIFHECVARVKMLIFSTHEMKYIWYLSKKSKFSFSFILNGNT